MKPVVSTKRALILDGEEQDGIPPKGPNVGTKRAGADKKKQTEQTGVDSFIDFETARELQEFLESLSLPYPELSPLKTYLYDKCFPNDNEAIINGQRITEGDNFLWDYGNKKLTLTVTTLTAYYVRGIRLQEQLGSVQALQDKVVPVYRADFSGKDPMCSDAFVFEEEYGSRILDLRITDDKVALQIAARGLGILKALHSVGLVNGNLASDMVWLKGKPESLRLRGFGHMLLYYDARNVKRVALKCGQTLRGSVNACPAPVSDLTQFSGIVSTLLKDHPLSVEFKKAVDELDVSGTFEYGKWINTFKSQYRQV